MRYFLVVAAVALALPVLPGSKALSAPAHSQTPWAEIGQWQYWQGQRGCRMVTPPDDSGRARANFSVDHATKEIGFAIFDAALPTNVLTHSGLLPATLAIDGGPPVKLVATGSAALRKMSFYMPPGSAPVAGFLQSVGAGRMFRYEIGTPNAAGKPYFRGEIPTNLSSSAIAKYEECGADAIKKAAMQ